MTRYCLWSRILIKIRIGGSLKNVENPTALDPHFLHQSVALRTDSGPYSLLLPTTSLMEAISCKNHLTCTLFWSGEIFLYPCLPKAKKTKARLKRQAVHPLLHYSFQKYQDSCSSLHMPYYLIPLGLCIYPFWNTFSYLSTQKTSHPDIMKGTLKGEEIRMEKWEGARSYRTFFSTLGSFQNFFFFCKGWETTENYKPVLERGERPSATEPVKNNIVYL